MPSKSFIPTVNGPAPLEELFSNLYLARVQEGDSFDAAEQAAWKGIRHAGWYKTNKNGWKQIGPDLREKVNVREAHKQPDGRFCIFDVDVFYPNAVKGHEASAMFDITAVKRAVDNTNTSVTEGGQKPALTLEHPHPAQKALGIPKPAFGSAINFRISPKNGMVRCDLENVDPTVVDQWRKGQWLGLSAGFVEDAGSLNLRFGHVALLGADMQSLSYLPMTEIFSAKNAQVCFSADATLFSKGSAMPTPKELFAAKHKHTSALAAAYASAAAGEPGAEKKVFEAITGLKGARKQFGAEFLSEFAEEPPMEAKGEGEHEDEAQDKALIESILGGKEDDGDNTDHCSTPRYEAPTKAKFESQGPYEESLLPADAQLTKKGEQPPTTVNAQHGADGGSSEFSAQVASLQKENAQLSAAVRALLGRQMKQDFAAYLAGLTGQGHQFDAKTAMDAFVQAAGNTKAIAALKALLEASPKSNLDNRHFSAEDSQGNIEPVIRNVAAKSSDANPEEVLTMLREKMPGMKFSATDVQLGQIAVRR